MQPFISVIIPTYNEEKWIAQQLERLSGIKGIEIIISDGGSTDKTREICALYPVQVISGNKGRGKQLNLGAQHAKGRVLFFLHADSIPEEKTFEEIKMAVENNFQWGCCTLSFDGESFCYFVLTITSRLRALFFSSCYGDQGIFCEQKFFIKNGGFPDLPLMEDVVFSHKLRRLCRAKVLPAKIITSSRRFEKMGFWRTILLMQKLKLLFFFGMSPERLARIYEKGRN